MGRGVSIRYNRFSDASACFVALLGWLFLLLNNSYKWFERCQGCRSRQSPERDRLVYFPRLQNVCLAISSLPFERKKIITTKQKHAARQILDPTWMDSPRVPTGMPVRSSAGLRLHNAIFPVKVWRASGVSSEAAAVGTQPSGAGLGGGGFFPVPPGRTVGSRLKSDRRQTLLGDSVRVCSVWPTPGALLWETGGVSKCWRNPENCHYASNLSGHLLVCIFLLKYPVLKFCRPLPIKIKTGKLRSWVGLFRSALCRERNQIIQTNLNINLLVLCALFGAIFTFNWR